MVTHVPRCAQLLDVRLQVALATRAALLPELLELGTQPLVRRRLRVQRRAVRRDLTQ